MSILDDMTEAELEEYLDEVSEDGYSDYINSLDEDSFYETYVVGTINPHYPPLSDLGKYHKEKK